MIEIPLTQGKVAIVDDCDAHLLAWKWYAQWNTYTKTFYAVRGFQFKRGKGGNRLMWLHHAVMGRPLYGKVVDHSDGNTLDCRRANLRIATSRENASNIRRRREGLTTSSFPGVSWEKFTSRWKAQISLGGKHKNLGRFDSEQEAAEAYRFAAQSVAA